VADVVAVHVFVTGRVHNVWYRQSCADEAAKRGVGGWVRNLIDGRVELWLEGARPNVEEVLAWCRIGPPRAVVSTVEIRDVSVLGLERFEVRD
jgi:acylphosphatase